MELEATIDDLAPRILAYCHGLTRDRALAEDAAQDALAALVRRWRAGGKPQSPAAFVFAIARRRAIRALVKQRLLAPFAGPVAETLMADARSASESRSELARVMRAISQLASRDRQALLLVAVGELDHAEAAGVLGIAPAALKMRVCRARKRLAVLLNGGSE